jgi:putative DNA primase/helicase
MSKIVNLNETPDNELSRNLIGAARKIIGSSNEPNPSTDIINEDDPRSKLPRIHIRGGMLSEMARRAEALLIEAKVDLFQRGQKLVMPMQEFVPASNGAKTKSPTLRDVREATLLRLLSDHVAFRRWNGTRNAWVYTDPPKDVIGIMLDSYGLWNFRPVISVMGTPTLRHDGTVLSKAGYDRLTSIYLLDPPEINVPEKPTRDDALAALAMLSDLLCEFPFIDGPSRSVGLSSLITPVIRGALDLSPMHGISANAPGTGKSELVNLAAAIATGFRCPVIAQGRTEEETEKRLGASLIKGNPIISIDNVNGEIGGEFLCQAIDQQIVEIRILSRSENRRITNTAVMFTTGNNLQPVGDVVRRTLMCWLRRDAERPELHQFTCDPVGMVLANRAKYITAVLTIVRAYIVAGCPDVCGPYGSFGDWNRLVRSPLVWLGEADPVTTIEQSRKGDTELNTIRAIQAAMAETLGLNVPKKANQILRIASDDGNAELREALSAIKGSRKELDGKALGLWLRQNRNRIVDGLKIDCDEDAKHGNGWFVTRVNYN